jgi:hypothetical protein
MHRFLTEIKKDSGSSVLTFVSQPFRSGSLAVRVCKKSPEANVFATLNIITVIIEFSNYKLFFVLVHIKINDLSRIFSLWKS